MPLDGLGLGHDSGSVHCDMLKMLCFRTAWGGAESADAVNRSIGTAQHQFAELGGQKRLSNIANNGKNYKRPSELQHLECINRVSQFKKNRSGELCNCERRNTVASLAIPRAAAQSAQIFGGGQVLPITSSVLDYEEVTIPEDSVIYCDIPYEDTNVYNKAEGFDYERFYQWCERQTQPVFISSYQMPEDRFDCIEEFTHRSTLSATANNLVTERIYVPKHQAERGNRIVQLTLF